MGYPSLTAADEALRAVRLMADALGPRWMHRLEAVSEDKGWREGLAAMKKALNWRW